jgi:uncharacterized protein involved in tolerance to divalent cations
MVLIYIVAKNKEEGKKISLELLEKKFAHSINIFPEILSMKQEDGKITEYSQTLVTVKTKALLYPRVEKLVQEIQAIDDPVIFSLPITQLHQDLFDRIQQNTMKV